MMTYILQALVLSTVAIIHNQIGVAALGFDIGVNYGMLGNDLPDPSDVVNICKKYGIGKIRLFHPNHTALDAFRKKGIDITLGIRNEDLPAMAASQEATQAWWDTNIAPYLLDLYFPHITVGNEIIPSEFAPHILPVMQNLQKILDAYSFDGIKVSTVLSSGTLATSFPPSEGAFTAEATTTLEGVLQFLSQNQSPLLINVYPYFAIASDPVNIRLDYALFTANETVVQDGNLSYTNLFDATVDAFFSAMEKLGFSDVQVLVSETGWPSDGNGDLTTPQLAYTYNWHVVRHVQHTGTPKRPDAYKNSGYIFAMFNENQKPEGVEQHFGLMYANMTPVYLL